MIRKLWLELRWVFPLVPLALVALTLEYTWAFQRASIMVFNDQNGYGVSMTPDPISTEEISTFLKEHPEGRILSLQTSPETYFLGFDGIARIALPFLVVALCAGGILSERSNGTTSFSLSLPVSRASWLWSRTAAALFLTGVAASLSCIVTYGLAGWMGVHQGMSWLVIEPLLLTLGVAPWIGVSLYIQSLLSGRFDPTAEAVIALAVTVSLVFLAEIFLPNSALRSFGNPYSALLEAAESPAHFAAWKPLLATGLAGIASLLLAVRRFGRMDC